MRRILFAIVESLMAVAPSLADIRILSSVGGEVGEYLKLFEAFRQSGERIVIDGPCYSACTLVLATIPQDRICVTRKAVLGFHAARLRDENGRIYSAPEATRLVAAGYPAGVRAWINRHGGLTGKTIFLRVAVVRIEHWGGLLTIGEPWTDVWIGRAYKRSPVLE